MQKDIDNGLEAWQREFEADRNQLMAISDRLLGAFRSSNYRELRKWRSLARWHTQLFNRRSSRYEEWKELGGQVYSDYAIYERQTACREELQRISRLYTFGVYL